jgi:hypothetical protein
MDALDFSDVYHIGGELLQNNIEQLKSKEREQYLANADKRKHIESCINYLLTLNDDDFKSIYLDLSTTDDAVDLSTIEDAVDDVQYESNSIYDQYDHAYAIVSSYDLLVKGLAISSAPLNYSIKACTRDHVCMYIDFTVDSCELLFKAWIDVVDLLYIAYFTNNYESMTYLLKSCMTSIDYANLIIDPRFKYNSIRSMLIIDGIQAQKDEYIQRIFKNRYIVPNIYNFIDDVIIKCYYIIKYMTPEDVTSYIKKLDTDFSEYISLQRVEQFKVAFNQRHMLHMQLLEYYLKPRGAHTKSATN